MSTTTKARATAERLFPMIQNDIRRVWGPAFDQLGTKIQTAIASEAVLNVMVGMDESIAAETVVAVMGELKSMVLEAYLG